MLAANEPRLDNPSYPPLSQPDLLCPITATLPTRITPHPNFTTQLHSQRALHHGSTLPRYFPRAPHPYAHAVDALLPVLTVQETLLYSTRLRLPSVYRSLNKYIELVRVEALMTELRLSHVAGSRTRDENIRGVSGGERRHVLIGVDMIHDPAILILDEPTSGLDSTDSLA
uniref:ABC transporter domain-containing protein n=1 Tax=Physcomitrium patens TaxID=3218 RepID=A0A7I4CGX8_PHYPA